MVRTKRWNDPREPEDGFRLLVCRYRPRGVPREGEPWDVWCAALAPSKELHAAAYGKGVPTIAWEDYVRRYLEEMSHQTYWISGFARRVRDGEALTLLCSSACVDPTRCHRTLLAKLIEASAFPRTDAAKDSQRVIRRRERAG